MFLRNKIHFAGYLHITSKYIYYQIILFIFTKIQQQIQSTEPTQNLLSAFLERKSDIFLNKK